MRIASPLDKGNRAARPNRAVAPLLLCILLLLTRFSSAAVCTLSLNGAGGFASFAGVGFQQNVVAYLRGTLNGQPDNQIGDYQAQIDWGDGGQWESASLVFLDNGRFQVKGSHRYPRQGSYAVSVKATGACGNTAGPEETTVVAVTPMPSGIPGKPANSQANPASPSNVTVSLAGAGSFTSFAGVGFQQNVTAYLYATLNGEQDNEISHFQAQINWGDDDQWVPADLVMLGDGRFQIKGSHRYRQQKSSYPVVVYVNGPDGTSVAEETTSVAVSPMPSGIPGKPASSVQSPSQPSVVTVSLSGAGGFTSYAGVGFERNLTAYLYGTLNGQPDNKIDDFHAQINWGDSDRWIAAELVALGNGRFQVKGSHRYAQQKSSYPVVVYVNGPDGTSVAEETTSATVLPMPSGIPGKPANTAANAGEAGNVTVSLSGAGGFSAPAAVEFEGKLVAYFYGTLNNQPNKAVGDYQAQINWGDSDQWDYAQLLAASGTLRAYGSHVYWTQGTYPVVVYLNGPDGTSVAEETTQVTVGPPSPLPSPDDGKNLGGSCLDSNGPSLCAAGQHAGNPINNTTGNKYQLELDYAGAGAFPLNFVRHYNSQADGAGNLGANWSHSYSAHLRQASATSVTVTRADRKTFNFNLAAGVWTPEADVNAKLERLRDGQGRTAGWRYTAGDDSLEAYDAGGKLLSIASRAGLLTQTLSYDAKGRLSAVSDPFGRSLAFVYDARDRIASMTDPAGEVYTYAYDTRGNLASVTYPDAKTRAYAYENAAFPHALTGLIDENGRRYATFGYDGGGLAVLSEHAGGAGKVTLSYDKANNATHVTDALGTTRTYSYGLRQGVWRMLKASRPCAGCAGDAAAQSFDANGNLTSRTDFNGNTTCYAYDLSRNLQIVRVEGFAPGASCPPSLASHTPAKGSLQRKITTVWHPLYRLPTKIDEPGRSVRYVYDAQGNLLKATLAAGGKTQSWAYTYNNLGQILSVDGPRTDVKDLATFAYDAHGNLASITNALGQTTRITAYDAHGRPLGLEDPNSLIATLAYDLRGRLASRAVGAELTRYTYSAAGDLLKVVLPDASFLGFSYDAAHRLTGLRDALGNHIAYTLNALGEQTAEKVYDPLGSLTETRRSVFNGLGRLSQSLGAAQQKTAYSYGANGNLARITDPLGQVSVTHYDALNRLSKSIDARKGVTRYGYDAHDRLVQVIDPKGFATAYTYDGFDNLLTIQSPDSRRTVNTYDAAGNLKTTTDARGKRTTYTYDALNRATSATYADNRKTTYQYDKGANGVGHLTRLTDPSGSTAWAYDNQGRVVQKQQQTGAVTLTTRYGYDAQGRPATLTYPSGKRLAYGYDAQGQIQSITVNGQPLLSAIAYQPFGAAKSWTFGNSGEYSSRFDLDGRIVQFPLANDSRTVSYDAAGRITALADNGLQQDFDYDALGRLTRFSAGAASQSYRYDRNGNRLGLDSNAGNTAYSYASANRLTASSGQASKTYRYDAAGNILGDGVRSYAYDARGRLVKATQGASSVVYSINGQGQRVGKRGAGVPSGARRFVYGESGQLLGEYDAAGKPVQETVWLGGQPVAVLTKAGRFYVYADQIGTPRRITNQAGATVWSWDGDPFGNGQPASSGGFAYNLRFPGQYFDAETGLHYNYFRDYDPTTGRYLQSDPIGLAGGINGYGYVGGNPVSGLDPAGLITLQGGVQYDEAEPHPILQNILNFEYGIEDAISGGLSEAVRKLQGYRYLDENYSCSLSYGAGTVVGNLIQPKRPDRLARAVGQRARMTGSAAKFAAEPGIRSAYVAAKDSKPAYIVTPRGVAIPTNPAELQSNLSVLTEQSVNPASSRKFIGQDSLGPLRIRIEKAHPPDPNFTGVPDPLHTVDHIHIERRVNVNSGAWYSQEKTSYEWPF